MSQPSNLLWSARIHSHWSEAEISTLSPCLPGLWFSTVLHHFLCQLTILNVPTDWSTRAWLAFSWLLWMHWSIRGGKLQLVNCNLSSYLSPQGSHIYLGTFQNQGGSALHASSINLLVSPMQSHPTISGGAPPLTAQHSLLIGGDFIRILNVAWF